MCFNRTLLIDGRVELKRGQERQEHLFLFNDLFVVAQIKYINAEKEKDYLKSIPLKIFTKDIGNCADSKTITVKNSDTASKIINKSLSILGITESERDYQLWVNSDKEEAPYRLIGHEYLYGIKMSHLRDTALLAELSKDSTSPSSLQEPFLIEELPREMQCRFILKPSHLAETQQLSEGYSLGTSGQEDSALVQQSLVFLLVCT
ncbi:Rho GTPase-activating protein 20 [Pteropus alecto]|uniref:Rho GTPase-activating protein 20 n=1 Tax=Pteropus alecto TaxID=9402 RepID=L5K492_PTEAL|nr:Rho GTPase-activating protein 20 [Pteropus alecto]